MDSLFGLFKGSKKSGTSGSSSHQDFQTNKSKKKQMQSSIANLFSYDETPEQDCSAQKKAHVGLPIDSA